MTYDDTTLVTVKRADGASSRVVEVTRSTPPEGRFYAALQSLYPHLRGVSAVGRALNAFAFDGADATNADFSAAQLVGATFADACLAGARFTSANLTGAYLRRARVTGADFRTASLVRADLADVDFSGADLRGADLTGANLDSVDLSAATLDASFFRPFRDGVWSILTQHRSEAPAVWRALRNGRVNGSTYYGECSCLLGTIAAEAGEDVTTYARDAKSPAEAWFLMIEVGTLPGDGTGSGFAAAKAVEWVEEWAALSGVALEERSHV